MKTWTTPIIHILDIADTKNGTTPATYESDYAGHMVIDGIQYCVVSGFVYLYESGSGDTTKPCKPYYVNENGEYIYYEG